METYMSNTNLNDEIRDERITDLENAVIGLNDQIQQMHQVLKDAQSVIVKIAQSQHQVIERVKLWPYITIDKNDDKNI